MYLLQDSLNMKSSKNSIYLNLLSKIMSVIFDQFDLALLNRNIIKKNKCYYNNVQ